MGKENGKCRKMKRSGNKGERTGFEETGKRKKWQTTCNERRTGAFHPGRPGLILTGKSKKAGWQPDLQVD